MLRFRLHVGVLQLVGCVAFASAGGISHSEIPAPLQSSPALTGFQTDGDLMDGMSVTVFFSAAPAETAIWSAGAPADGAGAAAGAGWSLREDGDTFTSAWTLSYGGGTRGLLTGFVIDGFAAGAGEDGVVFDRTFGGAFGTPGSFRGRDLELVNPVFFDVDVLYRGGVGISAVPPVGDEFRFLEARFWVTRGEFDDREVSGLGDNVRELVFLQDSNNATVPEPSSLMLLAAGGTLLLLRRRR